MGNGRGKGLRGGGGGGGRRVAFSRLHGFMNDGVEGLMRKRNISGSQLLEDCGISVAKYNTISLNS